MLASRSVATSIRAPTRRAKGDGVAGAGVEHDFPLLAHKAAGADIGIFPELGDAAVGDGRLGGDQ